ncbi:MAG: DUF4864 domain-containing protein [Betaproteobacteria bacterium]
MTGRAHRIFAAMILAAAMIAAAPCSSANAEPRRAESSLRAAEWTSIRQVIGAQRKALKEGDGKKALSYASPGIREQFATPGNFLAMVRNGYNALLAARYTEFLEGAVIDGAVIQPVRLVAPDNSVVVALYTMEKQKDGQWKIAGCILAPSTVQAA